MGCTGSSSAGGTNKKVVIVGASFAGINAAE